MILRSASRTMEIHLTGRSAHFQVNGKHANGRKECLPSPDIRAGPAVRDGNTGTRIPSPTLRVNRSLLLAGMEEKDERETLGRN